MNLEFGIWICTFGQNPDIFYNIILIGFGQEIFTVIPITPVKDKSFERIKPIITIDTLLFYPNLINALIFKLLQYVFNKGQ